MLVPWESGSDPLVQKSEQEATRGERRRRCHPRRNKHHLSSQVQQALLHRSKQRRHHRARDCCSLIICVSCGLLVLFRQRWNHQGRLAKGLAANAYTVYLIHPLVLISFAYAFHVVALYPLLKFVIAVLITLPLCFLISSLIRRIPLANRVL